MGQGTKMSADDTARHDAETLLLAAKWAELVRDHDPVHADSPETQDALTQMADGIRMLAMQVRTTKRPMSTTFHDLRRHMLEEAGKLPTARGNLTVQRDGTVFHTTVDSEGATVEVQITPPPLLQPEDLPNLQYAEKLLSRTVENWGFVADAHGGPWSDGSHVATLTMVAVFATMPAPLLAALLGSAVGTIARTRSDTPNGSGDMPA